jgi:hypothetical protein
MLLSDTGLVICAATNPFCLLFIPAVIWPYLKGVLCHHSQTGILNRKGLVSLTMLVIMSAIIAFKPLTTSMEPYKDLTIKLTPSMAVEIGVARNIIYPVIHPYYHKMGTVSVLLILVLTVGIIAKFGKKENYGIYAGAGLLLLITTVVLVITRPMLRFNADGYSSTYPDRYYFAQNMIGIVILIIFANDLESRISGRWIRFLPLILLLVNSFLPINRNAPGKLSSSQFIPADNGLFCDQVVQSYEHYLLMSDKTHPPGMPYLRVYIFPNDPKCSVKLPLERVRDAIGKRSCREGS